MVESHEGDWVLLECGEVVNTADWAHRWQMQEVWCNNHQKWGAVIQVASCPHNDNAPAPRPTGEVERDAAYGYSSAYGYCAQQLEFIRARCDRALRIPGADHYEAARFAISEIRDMADRAIQSANDALRRYDARIEKLDPDHVIP